MKYVAVVEHQGLVMTIVDVNNNEPREFDDRELAEQAAKCLSNVYRIVEINTDETANIAVEQNSGVTCSKGATDPCKIGE